MKDSPSYRAAAPETLRIVPLDALTLIYHHASGMTHVVDAPVPEILETLGDKAMTGAQLLAQLSQAFDLGDADPAALTLRLDEMVASGLVERL
ncbi:HPr-rel-A system PqqD family peptide chaperone [Sphingosinithalassobacter portus]|uniref:HPr-rel-A system PqqD family peptide chaperone n=1 Tax=Stakelama portus TaxID=2676234 RepID=UPI001EFCC01E|nr:HPr-rel-A system PqqD family peptide chaperone [Sphingosinithalassobacter portus]